jgi:hypothetical protein
MTENPQSPSGLSIFDDPNAPRRGDDATRAMPAVGGQQGPPPQPSARSAYQGRPQFPMVRRGYDKDSVDAFIAHHEGI